MMYVGFPRVTEEERARTLEPIAWQGCCRFPQRLAPDDAQVLGTLVENVAGVPVMRLRPAARAGFVLDLQQGAVIRIDAEAAREIALAVGALAPQAMRSAELLRAEILGAVPGDQGPIAKPDEGLMQRRRGDEPLHALEAGLQQRRIGAIEHVADVIAGRDFPNPEQRLAVRAPLAFLQGALEREKRGALHEKQGKRRKAEVGHVAAAPLPGIRKARADRAQSRKKGRQKLHPNGGITSPLIWESLKCACLPLLELLQGIERWIGREAEDVVGTVVFRPLHQMYLA